MNLLELNIKDYHKMLLNNEITTRQLVEFYLDRISRYDDKLQSIICINENVLEEADLLDKTLKEGGLKGKLHGVPILLKDNVDTKDMPTTAGSLSLQGFIPQDDAKIVKLMKLEGGLIIAKTNLHEFAIWGETISSIKGQTINPYDHTRTPGGSSGGTGASVAANFGMIGIGTDTINSVRSPSSANNLVGIRPTSGLVSKERVVPYSLTQDCVGPITRNVEDCQILLEVLSEKTFDQQAKKRRIGILRDFFGKQDIHDETNKAMEDAIDHLKKDYDLVELKESFDSGYLVSEVSVHLFELKDHLNKYLNALPEEAPVHSYEEILSSGRYHPGIKENLYKANELSTSSEDYKKRLRLRKDVQERLKTLYDEYNLDGILYPHQKQLVCEIGGSQKERNGVLSSVTGYPSICLPAGFSSIRDSAPIGVPIGMEILGRPYSENVLIEIAKAYEKRAHMRKSPILERSNNG